MKSLSITIWVTTDCNMKCTYCYEGKDKNKKYMTRDTAKKVIEYISNLITNKGITKCKIHFHGGEPLLNIDIVWFIIEELNLIKDCVIKYSLTTNGSLITESIIDKLKYIDDISVSIDGAEYTNNLYRKDYKNEGNYKDVISNCRLLLNNKPDLSARMTIRSDTVQYAYENIFSLIDKGFKNIRFALDSYDKNWENANIDVLYNQLRKVKEKLIKENMDDIKVNMLNNVPFSSKGDCDGGKSNIHIYPNGILYPCVIVAGNDEFICGDIYRGVSYEWLEKIDTINSLKIEECKGCELVKACTTTRCKLVNRMLTGSYAKPCGIVCATENLKYRLLKV